VYVEKESDTLHVKTKKIIEAVKINNISGQVLFAKNFKDGSYSEQIDLSGFNRGVYVVSVKTEAALASTTFIY